MFYKMLYLSIRQVATWVAEFTVKLVTIYLLSLIRSCGQTHTSGKSQLAYKRPFLLLLPTTIRIAPTHPIHSPKQQQAWGGLHFG
jgi:hypothetical protein